MRAISSFAREVSYTDLRGGCSGIWTDKSRWLEWKEICGAFDEELFSDGKGDFGHEDEEGDGMTGKVKAVHTVTVLGN